MQTPDASFLAPGRFVDSDHPSVIAFARESIGDASTDGEKASRLFRAVRERLRYDPYTITRDPGDYLASRQLDKTGAYCIPKAVLLAAAARAVGVPARLGFADVTNHLSSPKLHELLGTDLFVYHGFTEVWVDGKPYKLTCAFNSALCEKFGVRTLDFDAAHPEDALLQPFDGQGRPYMDYVKDRGRYLDLPLDEIIGAFDVAYPRMMGSMKRETVAGARDDAFHRT